MTTVRATTAFAALAVLVGITLVVFNYSGGENVVGIPNQLHPETNSKDVKESLPNEQHIQKNEITTNDNPIQESEIPIEKPVNMGLKQKPVGKTKVRPRNRNVPASQPKPEKEEVVPQTPRPNKSTVARENSIENPEIPKLSDLVEEEDDSLRLSDLFDEVGSD